MRFALPSLLAGGSGEAQSGQRCCSATGKGGPARNGSLCCFPGTLPTPVLNLTLPSAHPVQAWPEENLCAWGGRWGVVERAYGKELSKILH